MHNLPERKAYVGRRSKSYTRHRVEIGFSKASVGGLLVLRENKTATNCEYPLRNGLCSDDARPLLQAGLFVLATFLVYLSDLRKSSAFVRPLHPQIISYGNNLKSRDIANSWSAWRHDFET